MPRIYTRRPLLDRVVEKIDRAGPVHPVLGTRCWAWRGPFHSSGYAVIGSGGKYGRVLYVHRYALESALGRDLDAGEWALHHCDNPGCVNPEHLFVGDAQANVSDMDAKGRRRFNAPCGVDHHAAKLTPAQIEEARRRWKNSGKTGRSAKGETLDTISKEFGVASTTLHAALKGKTWKA